MAASRPKYRGVTRSALKVSRTTWFHSVTTFADGRLRSSNASRDNRGRRGRGAGARGARRNGQRDFKESSQGRSDMVTLLLRGGLRGYGRAIAAGAQTERRGGAGPVRGLLGGKDLTGRFCSENSRLHWRGLSHG